jgi:hypothetical protein
VLRRGRVFLERREEGGYELVRMSGRRCGIGVENFFSRDPGQS